MILTVVDPTLREINSQLEEHEEKSKRQNVARWGGNGENPPFGKLYPWSLREEWIITTKNKVIISRRERERD